MDDLILPGRSQNFPVRADSEDIQRPVWPVRGWRSFPVMAS